MRNIPIKFCKIKKNKLKYETYKALCEIKVYELQEEYLKMLVEQKRITLT